MQRLVSLFHFYRRIFVPALVLSLVVGSISEGLSLGFSLITLGCSYIIFSLILLYITYEIRFPNEYYFYYNLGFSKVMLWGFSVGVNLLLVLIFIAL